MSEISGARKIILVVGALALVFGSYLTIRIISLANALNESATIVQGLQNSAKFEDLEVFEAGIVKLAKAATTANSIAHDPVLAPAEWLPIIGKDFAMVKAIVGPAQELSATAQPMLKYLGELRKQAAAGAGFDSKAAHALRDAFNQFSDAANRADVVMQGIDATELHFGLAEKLPPIRAKFHDTAMAMQHLQPLIKAFATVLANPTVNQRWFVATQNLAEARGTGGLLGSYAILNVKNGKITLAEAGSDTKLLAAGGVNHSALPAELNDVWGVDLNDWRDFNVSAHVPYSGEIIAASWKKAFKQSIDGVLFMGQGTVAEMVAATGPITVQGRTLVAEETQSFLSKGVYAAYPDPAKKNKFVARFMQSLFAKLVTSPPNLPSLLGFVSTQKSADKVYAWSADADTQTDNVAQGIAGVVSETEGSQTWFTLNNAGGNKLDAWLQLKASYSLGQCGAVTADGFAGRKGFMAVVVRNNAPKSGLPAYTSPRLDLVPGTDYTVGSNRTLLTVYAPVGASAASFKINGKTATAWAAVDRKHPIYVFELQVDPGSTQTVQLEWVEPVTNLEGHSTQTVPSLTVPAMLNPVQTRVVSKGFCSIQ